MLYLLEGLMQKRFTEEQIVAILKEAERACQLPQK